ncbi:hypothetical protein [Streptomyces sp. NPDC050504]|uniref:hypothetical protein n=1 Tax=Streptomyces sp. NPDC050504 TaxID=3365618 RepID=UPI0037B59BD1
MNTAEVRREEPPGAGRAAVLAVLLPVLFGTSAAIFLLVGYVLTTIDPEPAFARTLLNAGWLFGGATVLAVAASAIGLLVVALRHGSQVEEAGSPASRRTAPPSGRAARRTVDFASFVAGTRRAHLREEWSAVLAGDPEGGTVLSARRRMSYALGFLWAALRMRLSDVGSPLWVPVDWLLSAESRTNGFIALGVGAQVVYIQHQDGFHALATEGWGWCAGCGIALRLFVSWLRRVRGIEMASRQSDTRDE